MSKRILKRKKKGFVITVEVMFTIAFMALCVDITAGLLKRFEIYRYVSSTLTHSAIAASKWGGNNSKSWQYQGNDVSISKAIANEVTADLGPNVLGNLEITPDTVTESNSKIKTTVTWTYPSLTLILDLSIFEQVDRTMYLEINSMTKGGGLLG